MQSRERIGVMLRLCKCGWKQGWLKLGCGMMSMGVQCHGLEVRTIRVLRSMWILLAHSHFFALTYFFISPIFLLFFSSLFLSFFSFWRGRTSTILGTKWFCCGVLTDLPHTWTFVSHDTKSQWCGVGISKCVPSIREYQVCSRCSSHTLGHRMLLVF